MCQSYDKTTLFLVSFLRFLFYLTVAYYTYQFEINIWIKNSLIILAIFNTFIVIYVILKKQKYIKKNEKNKIEIIDGEPEIVYEFPAGYGTPLF
ncbi:MAG: hypothetical protein CMF62_00210 [Magnetococcales bacterium]|nr:hypothetical protein [Magnetococcales bacterium]|tara:strand:- start:17270 stop:17551 length:282 start_codon:yes stop_codon:yes gene_type:complete